MPVVTPPVTTPPVVTPPVVTPPVVTPPVTTPPIETPPVVTPPVTIPPIETPPVVTPPVTTPPIETPPVVTPPVVDPYVPIPTPIVPTPPVVDPTHPGTYTWGTPPAIHLAQGLNPGWITNVPQYYHPTNTAGSQYTWGQHPLQPGPTFNPSLYNQVPNAPITPFGLGYAQTAATAAQILAMMRGQYPLLGTTSEQVASKSTK